MRIVRLFVLLLFALAVPASAAEVRLSVAASLTEAVRELASAHAAATPGVKVQPNFGSSGALAKQIVEGAPADIFISANQKWMDHLVQEKQVSKETVRTLAENTLVFIVPKGTNGSSLKDLPVMNRIAIGSPKSVPAGEYAKQVLEKAGFWERLASGGKLVMTEDVRQALLFVDRGEVDGAFVYRTDALLAKEARIAFEIPRDLYDPVTYPVGLTARGAKNPAAVAFHDFLKKPKAKKILQKYGFN